MLDAFLQSCLDDIKEISNYTIEKKPFEIKKISVGNVEAYVDKNLRKEFDIEHIDLLEE